MSNFSTGDCYVVLLQEFFIMNNFLVFLECCHILQQNEDDTEEVMRNLELTPTNLRTEDQRKVIS